MKRAISPTKLLNQAERLCRRNDPNPGQPRNADLRRAVSGAYYAVFHDIINRTTDGLLPGATPAERWSLARAIDHGAVHNVCKWITTGKDVPKRARLVVSEAEKSQDLIDIAAAFIALYQKRHDADYDNDADFTKPDTIAVIDQARDAITRLASLENTVHYERFFALVTMKATFRNY